MYFGKQAGMPNEVFSPLRKCAKNDRSQYWIKSSNKVQRKNHIPPVMRAKGANLKTVEFGSKIYEVDEDDFLLNPDEWDKNFADGMAPQTGISGELTPAHWDVLWFIREFYLESGKCPIVQKACKAQNLHIADLQRLFPSGYRRGACKLAGLCCDPEYSKLSSSPKSANSVSSSLIYRTNVRGFLVDPAEWNVDFAEHKWEETKMPGALTEKHWKIIYYLRARFSNTGKIPTIYETCGDNDIDIEEFDALFPDGYHRGAVKIAGLSG
jgi:tRNA 2-thiouridine synthesizing protein E